MFRHYGLDINTHVNEAGLETKKDRTSLNASILQDKVIIGVGLPKPSDADQKDFDFEDFVADVQRAEDRKSGPSGTGAIPVKVVKRSINQEGAKAPTHQKVEKNKVVEKSKSDNCASSVNMLPPIGLKYVPLTLQTNSFRPGLIQGVDETLKK